MRIRDAYTRLEGGAVGQAGATGKAHEARSAGSAKKADRAPDAATTVKVSARALEMSNSPKIAALKAAVEAGTYRVDAEKVAARLVGDEP